MSLEALNSGDAAMFAEVLGAVFENSPWLAERAAAARPFATRDDLAAALVGVLYAASPDEQLALIRAHPDLAGKAARAGKVTEFSAREQASAGLDRLTDVEFDRFSKLNAVYKARFGFPFIIAARDHTKESILAAFQARLANDAETESAEAVRNIGRIVSLRVADRVAE